jgi:DNA-binding MurR/RpiR family transcriptional regulator
MAPIPFVSPQDPSPALSSPTLARLRALLPSITRTDRKVADEILADPERATSMSVTELAAAAGTSESSVIRCCQRLGFTGFQDLKLRIARESYPGVRLVHQDISQDDPPADVLAKVVAANARVIHDVVNTVNPEAFEAVVTKVAGSRQILFIGAGQSSAPAIDAAYRFRIIGMRTDAPADFFTQHFAASLLGKDDLCLAISHTGATRETLACIQAARSSGAYTAAVTSFSRSPIVNAAHAALVAGGHSPIAGETGDAVVSRLAHLSVLDAVFISVVLRRMQPTLASLDRLNEITAEHQL